MTIPGMYGSAGPQAGHTPGQAYGTQPGSTIVNTMNDPLAQMRSPAASLRPLTVLLATLSLLGSFVVFGWRLSQDLEAAMRVLDNCPPGVAECLVDPVVRTQLVDPLLLAAGMFALAVGALTDSRRRPAMGLVLALGAVVIGVLLVTR